ncbi:NUDIX domain-containing protein [Tropicimonas isoalkanivorans]|uniref:GDP-mannose pyrophosphatase n=1 Tax=Tropicimonas isoalkanivorans TaxID=441112 RepID=A0A1I1LEZ1_9RHOB|nr:NUDIX hydrolase [Tropicimonas isoalkanivorans]SFC71536.1 ADP-ribose pyrophosphatase [Tropicimonas isoalkanivorans]
MTEEITTLSSRLAYQNRWMRVREDEIAFPDGHRGLYGVVEKPEFAVVVAQHGDGRIQMVNQYRYPVRGRYWELPLGAWEGQESPDPAALAAAELREETGYTAETWEQITYLHQAPGFCSHGFHLFRATGLVPGPVEREAEEQGMVSDAFSLDDILEMIRRGEIMDATTLAALGYLRLIGSL